MASSSSSWFALLLFVGLACTAANSNVLSAGYYEKTCPNVQGVVRSVMAHRVAGEPRMAPAVLRLFFHDCFVNGCDGSVLLDATPFSASEKDAEPNDSLTGFTVIDEIKSILEHDCPATVSCADVLALASRDAVALLGGPTWAVPLGRKDSRAAADPESTKNALPSPKDNLEELITMFAKHGLDASDMTALSGAHTVGMAKCESYRDRVYGIDNEHYIDPSFADARRQTCPLQEGPSDGKAPFDSQTPMRFDNAYYRDLTAHRGLLSSDQALYGGHGGMQDHLVEMYSTDGEAFARDFANAMVKMGNIPPPMGMPVESDLPAM
ncbi:peroxidase P7 isoform X2 [Brachypodium distachyon]|uniref:peroxidase P7 isoform X2 n=1 Tax=Brachypodium distachyon TaxID=15368 RepID=UPI000D0D1D92|nr:peroxidase P7 isoform X2 [Brachypodium distachyon]|eukprot:XP_024317161.1 peroxidase P7 isoform X2 [Brachypodium distachyon]